MDLQLSSEPDLNKKCIACEESAGNDVWSLIGCWATPAVVPDWPAALFLQPLIGLGTNSSEHLAPVRASNEYCMRTLDVGADAWSRVADLAARSCLSAADDGISRRRSSSTGTVCLPTSDKE